MKFSELTIKEFEDFASNHIYGSFLQSIEEYEWKKDEGYECYLLGVKQNDTVIAATFIQGMAVAKIYRYFYAPRGLLVDYEDKEVLSFFITHLKKFLYDKKGLYFKFDPYVPYIEHDKNGAIVEDGFDHRHYVENLENLGCIHGGFTTGFNAISQARWMMVLDIKDKDEQQLMKHMDQLRKRIIKKVDKSHVKVSFLKEDQLSLYESLVEETVKRKGFGAREHAYNQNLFRYFKDKVKIGYAELDVVSYRDEQQHLLEESQKKLSEWKKQLLEKESEKLRKKICLEEEMHALISKRLQEADTLLKEHGEWIALGSCLFILHGKEIVYLSGGSSEEFKKFNGPYAIQWTMIRYAIEHGFHTYNFYGTSGDFTKTASDYGVFEFKRGFNAVAVELLGDFYLPIRKGAFQVYQRLKHVI